MSFDIFFILAIVLIASVTYFKWSFTYWKKRNLPYLKPVFPYGTMENPLRRKQALSFWIKKNYDELKAQGHKHGGLYNFANPLYLPVDPEYVKNIMQKDFQYFTDRGVYYNEKDDPLSANLFALEGEKWRTLRAKLTPTFTSGKMKMMFHTMVTCSNPMLEAMDEYAERKLPVEIREVAACFTTDVICSTAFSLECNSFKSPNAEFRKYGKKILQFSILNLAKLIFLISKPGIGRFLGMTFFPRESTRFFMNIVKDTIKYRETHGIIRKDMIHLLMELENSSDTSGKVLTIEEIAAQAFVFFFAGFETSSTTMTFCLFELALHLDIQQKVRDEIHQILADYDGKITYEAIADMKYMEQVIEETLRKYSPVGPILRKCVKDYKVPNTDVTIEKGTNVMISTLGLHHDPEYYPDPEKFDPERFSKEKRKQIQPFTYIPFGEGPRICIGARFGVMQIKVGLTALLKNYKFTLNKDTKVPLVIDPLGIVLTPKETIWLDTEKVE